MAELLGRVVEVVAEVSVSVGDELRAFSADLLAVFAQVGQVLLGQAVDLVGELPGAVGDLARAPAELMGLGDGRRGALAQVTGALS